MKNTPPMESAKNKLIAIALKDISPWVYQVCEDVVKPLVTDIDQLPIICQLIGEVKELSNENFAFYCAVILRLYSPGHLYLTGLRLPTGLRSKFIEHFGYNNVQMWNHWSAPVRGMMKNSRVASAVNVCAIDIVERLKTNGSLLDDKPLQRPVPATV